MILISRYPQRKSKAVLRLVLPTSAKIMARKAAELRAELNKTLPWYRKKLGRARGEMVMQAAFALNSFIVLVFIPTAIVYVTDAEWKKKYIPFMYNVRKYEVENHNFPAMLEAKRLEFMELKRMQIAGEAGLDPLSPAELARHKERRKEEIRKIEYEPEKV